MDKKIEKEKGLNPKDIEHLLNGGEPPGDINDRYYNHNYQRLVDYLTKCIGGSRSIDRDPMLHVLYALRDGHKKLGDFTKMDELKKACLKGKGYYFECPKCKWYGPKHEMVFLREDLVVGCPTCNK